MKSSVNLAIVALLWLTLVLACAEPKTSSPQANANNSQPTASPQTAVNSTPPKKETVQQFQPKELASYTHNKVDYSSGTSRPYLEPHKVVLIPANLSREELINLARQLHTASPTTSFDLFDDDSQAKAFADWDKNKNSDDSRKKYSFPEKFVREHQIGSIVQIRRNRNEEMKWHLIDDGGSTIATLD